MNRQKLETLIDNGYDFDIREAFENAWMMFKQYPAYSAGYTFFIISIQMIFVIYIPEYVVIFSLFLSGPLTAGYYLAANKMTQGDVLFYPDFFKGFQYYMALFSVAVIGQFLTGIGLVLFVLPGIYLFVAYLFAPLMTLFGGLDFWRSLEYSRRIIQRQWFKFFLFGIIAVVFNIAGALLFLVGLAITMPVTYFAIYYLFESITKDVFAQEVEEAGRFGR